MPATAPRQPSPPPSRRHPQSISPKQRARVEPLGLGIGRLQRRHHDLRLHRLSDERDASGRPPRCGALGWALAVAGLLIALLAPVIGQRSDASGRRKFWLGLNTYSSSRSPRLFFVAARPGFLWLGLVLLAAGNIFFEFAGVNYNAMLAQVSTPRSIGKVSGFGWGMGYIGGIVLLLIVYFGFISPRSASSASRARTAWTSASPMLVSAAWFGIFALPVLFAVPEYHAPRPSAARTSGSSPPTRASPTTSQALAREPRRCYFLLASAVFRDGLAGVFTFGGVLAARRLRLLGRRGHHLRDRRQRRRRRRDHHRRPLDDQLGPKPVIMASLIGLIVAGLAVFVLHDGGQIVFWIVGLALCLFVGPAQSAQPHVPRPAHPAGPRGRGVRALRDDRPRGQLPGTAAFASS